jgi:hypothetical protein
MKISVILITSPFQCMPSLILIENVLNSLKFLVGLEELIEDFFILLDGVKITDSSTQFKRGKINQTLLEQYDAYYIALQQRFVGDNRFKILRSSEHLGFAYMVKWGLTLCQTTYALILQHDRNFIYPFHRIRDLLQCMEEYAHIRYIGFPTANSRKHDIMLHCTYHLHCLNSYERIIIDDQLALQPLIFWFDSHHLAHVQRYLSIFTPLKNLQQLVPQLLPQDLPLSTISKMLMRKGDFIEDRFGQCQRNLLTQWQILGYSEEKIRCLFRWYGSYLCWPTMVLDGRDIYYHHLLLGEEEKQCEDEEEFEEIIVEVEESMKETITITPHTIRSLEPVEKEEIDAYNTLVTNTADEDSSYVDTVLLSDPTTAHTTPSPPPLPVISTQQQQQKQLIPISHNVDDGPTTMVMVSHMHGRTLDLSRIDAVISKYGKDNVKNRKHRLILNTIYGEAFSPKISGQYTSNSSITAKKIIEEAVGNEEEEEVK